MAIERTAVIGDCTLYLADCLDAMPTIEPGSIDLVLCDPPYGTISGIAETVGINHGMKGRTGWDAAIRPITMLETCEGVLRTNGAAILFSQEPYTSRLVTSANTILPFSYRMVWVKDHFANALLAKKAPLSHFEDLLVFRSNRGINANHDFDVRAGSGADWWHGPATQQDRHQSGQSDGNWAVQSYGNSSGPAHGKLGN